jgi:hypothetical protein
VQAGTGTRITFANVYGYVTLSAGVMKLNSAPLISTTPAAINPIVLVQ